MSFEPPQVGDKQYDRVMVNEAKNKRRARSRAEDGTATATSLGQVIIGLLVKRIPHPPRLQPEVRIQTRRRRAYYRVLNVDERFRAALEALFKEWSWTAAAEFAKLAGLPHRAERDLEWAYRLWKRGELRRMELQVGPFAYPGLDADANEDEAGRLSYRPVPSRLKDRDSLDIGALRLYRRAVLKWKWGKIVQVEERERECQVDLSTVWDDVHRWSAALGVALPDRPPGRPRAQRNS